MNESQTRLEKIDPNLKAAGWGKDVNADTRILTEQSAYVIAPGRVGRIKCGKPKKIDYLLTYRGRKLAIVEAKKDELPVYEGVPQAKEYAALMHIRYTYATNGDEIYFMDMQSGKEHAVDHFPSPEELWQWTYHDANFWRNRFNLEPFWIGVKSSRYYQEVAVNSVLDAVAAGRNRILLTLATGTGKTFIAFQICWKLMQTQWNLRAANDPSQCRLPRILFLADRNILANQALNDFGAFDESAMARLTPDEIRKRGDKVPKSSSLYFTIFQTFMSGTTPLYKQYSPDFFDFIIIDECHRGGANEDGNWRDILTYFSPACQLGMTATPKRKANIDTYKYFGEPVYTYSLKQGIEDGFLTPYRVKISSTPVDIYHYHEDDTIESGEEELDKSRDYTEKDFYHGQIEVKERDELRVKELLEQISPEEKTIVFCATQNHAAQIMCMINRWSKKPNPFYCVRVTADDGKEGESQLKTFQDSDYKIPTVLTTSQKLSTGVNASEVRNIVLLRPVRDIVEFKQIIGRGTRLFDHKYFFTIYDFVKAYQNFEDPEWDGDPMECPICGNIVCTCPPKEKRPCPICGESPCICEKPVPEPCPICGNLPCTCEGKEKKKKIVISLSPERKAELFVKWEERFMFDGVLISVDEFIKKLFGHLQSLFGSEEQLRERWATPAGRASLLNELAEAEFDSEKLQRVQALVDADKCDLLDVLEYIAYAKPKQDRESRATHAKSQLSAAYNDKQRQFLDFVLAQYVQAGHTVLGEDKLAA